MLRTSEVYSKLYHYTTWEGLQGILETQTMWATNYKFLNDYTEIMFFRDKLITLIHPQVRAAYEELVREAPQLAQLINDKGGMDHVVQNDAEAFVDAAYRALGHEIYILSFCGEHKNSKINNNGLLSQWRGYGTDGGAALVFNTKNMEEILEIEAQRFEYSTCLIADLVYSDDEQKLKEELSEDISIIADIVKQLFDKANLSKGKEVDLSRGYQPFIACISRYKHYGFSEENEVRVVALPTVINSESRRRAKAAGVTIRPEKEKKFRAKNGKQVPYIELFNSNDIKLPIEKIIVGPHKEKDTRAIALREKWGQTIEITCSDIPYVNR